MNNPSKIGLISGATLTLSSWIRYFVMWPDMDKAIVYGCVGVLIMGVSYLYDRIVSLENTLYSVEEYIQDKWEEQNDN